MRKMLLSVMAAILTLVGMVGISSMSPAMANAVDSSSEELNCMGNPGMNGCSSSQQSGLLGTIQTVVNVVAGLVAVVSVMMLVVGGISMATAGGDRMKKSKAHNTLLYGVGGLVIAGIAFWIVNFVVGNVF